MQTAMGKGGKGEDYYFVFWEKEKTIVVFKNGQVAYTVLTRVNKKGERVLACDCMGAINRFRILSPDKRCRHEKFVYDDSKFVFGKEVKYRSEEKKAAEEYYKIIWENYKSTRLNQNPKAKKRPRGSWITQSGRW